MNSALAPISAVPASIDPDQLRSGVEVANVPTLLMVLVQLTGELRWLEAPYRPTPNRGLGDHDSGGLPEEIQREIREAAIEAIEAWASGRPVALQEPSREFLLQMLSASMGEQIPAEYGAMLASELGVEPSSIEVQLPEGVSIPEGREVLIIGAGASGLCAAVYLQRLGIPFRIVEQHDSVGGVWFENKYPGAGVDTPNHLYSFSFKTHDWGMYFCLRDDLLGYLRSIVEEFGLLEKITFNTKVEAAEWDEVNRRWQVSVLHKDGHLEVIETWMVLSAAGVFNPPKYPNIPGLDRFAGESFHTARWPEGVDLTGKRVAMIGNGASAMQTGPEIADRVEKLTIFQRSVHWAAPFEQFRKTVPGAVRYLFSHVPLYRAWYRLRLGWTFNDRVYPSLQKDPEWSDPDRSLNAINDGHRRMFTRYIETELADRPDLVEKVLPNYPPFGKRMLMDNGWYRMLTKSNVELVSDGISEITENSVVDSSGTAHEADVLLVATGFDVLRFLSTYEIRGRNGLRLRDFWNDDDARAYLGMAVPGFPNLFTLYGPNTQPGHGGSLLYVIERQMHYIVNLMTQMFAEDVETVEVRPEIFEEFNVGVDRAHENMVWTHEGMETYYRNSRGRVTVNLPYRNVDLYHLTERANLDEFVVEKRITVG